MINQKGKVFRSSFGYSIEIQKRIHALCMVISWSPVRKMTMTAKNYLWYCRWWLTCGANSINKMTYWINANSHTNINYYCESKNCPKIELILGGNKSCKKRSKEECHRTKLLNYKNYYSWRKITISIIDLNKQLFQD